jgi:hypothetical protein
MLLMMTSARIYINNPANSKLASHYNRVAKIHLKGAAMHSLLSLIVEAKKAPYDKQGIMGSNIL